MTSIMPDDNGLPDYWTLTDDELLTLIHQGDDDCAIFGLDFPYKKADYAKALINRIISLDISEEAKEGILGKILSTRSVWTENGEIYAYSYCKLQNTFDSYLKYVHYTDSKRRKTRFSGATGWLLLACAAAVIVSFVKVGGNIFLYVVSAVLLICAAAYLYIQYLAPYRAFKKLDKSFFAEQEFDFYEDKLELIEHGEKA